MRTRLEERCDITEICLRNGTLEDCAGCPYTTCLHFGEQGGCFYGGVMVQEVYPAIREADALVLLCPNYNDALSANLTAAINTATSNIQSLNTEEKDGRVYSAFIRLTARDRVHLANIMRKIRVMPDVIKVTRNRN